MAAIGAFLEAHPETAAALGAAGALPPPASWLTIAYNGIHTFRWIAPDDTAHWVRTRWMPDGGVETLTDEDAQARDRDYLAADLRDRLAAVRLRSHCSRVSRRKATRSTTRPHRGRKNEKRCPSAGSCWSARSTGPRRRATFASSIRRALCDGIEPSGDPILAFRPKVYDVSARGRWTGE